MCTSKEEFSLSGSDNRMTEQEQWNALKTWVQGYILFDKIDRHSGNEVLGLMEELEVQG